MVEGRLDTLLEEPFAISTPTHHILCNRLTLLLKMLPHILRQYPGGKLLRQLPARRAVDLLVILEIYNVLHQLLKLPKRHTRDRNNRIQ